MKDKKGQMGIGVLVGIAVTFVVIIVVLAFGLNIVGDIQDDFLTNTANCNTSHATACGYDYNTTVFGQEALANISEKTPLLGTIIVASIIIGILVTAFVIKRSQE